MSGLVFLPNLFEASVFTDKKYRSYKTNLLSVINFELYRNEMNSFGQRVISYLLVAEEGSWAETFCSQNYLFSSYKAEN